MSRLWVLCVVASGCIYAEPINQRPSIGIVQDPDNGTPYRGSTVKLQATSNDPENQLVFFQWRAYACTDATTDATGNRPGCDHVPFFTSVVDHADIVVPMSRLDTGDALLQVLVLLEAQDDYGATAKPIQQLLLDVADHAPVVAMRKDSRYGYVVNTAINVYAKVSDPDDGPLTPELTWDVFTPVNQPAYDFVDITVPQDMMHLDEHQVGKRFTPKGAGDWEIQLKARDPQGVETMDSVMITVVPDHAPCLTQAAPIAAPTGSALPLTEATLFQVNVVTDDLDPFPATTDPELGTADFHWSILPPGSSTRQSLAVDGNAVPLDPANYAPGDIVELRVEIEDRNNTPVTCADNLATCSVISDNACIQRFTWRVEVR